MSNACKKINFTAPASHIYNPLEYAADSHQTYLRRFGNNEKKAVYLGMNPGPWGMAQTGVPFGEVNAVKNWMGIEEKVGSPKNPHPMRKVDGFSCHRSEVSGKRLWAMFGEKNTAEEFFTDNFVLNYCPLLFIRGVDGKCNNITPDKLKKEEQELLYKACDKFLIKVVDLLSPKYLIGVGAFAKEKLESNFDNQKYIIGKISHPSPANPKSNKNYNELARKEINEIIK